MIIQGIDFDEADFTLRWPRELFIYEAQQLLLRSDRPEFPQRVSTLCGEAFVDPDIERSIDSSVRTWAWTATGSESRDSTKGFLEYLMNHPELLRGYTRRVYYAERVNAAQQFGGAPQIKPLATSFYLLVIEMSEAGYFPEILPKICVDDHGDWAPDPSEKIRRRIGVPVKWPDDVRDDKLSEPVLYSVIEYLHDEAQRPRQRQYHDWDNCGFDYSDFSPRSGGIVYRWWVNKLLEQHDVGLKLGNEGEETGVLIKHAPFSLDKLTSSVVSAAPENDRDDKGRIEAAILAYRRRDASTHDRRIAISSLAGVLEHYRDEFKKVQFTKGDEGALFEIFNKFTIRHNKKTDRGDYHDDYLDWIFWTTLAAIQLVYRLGLAPEEQGQA